MAEAVAGQGTGGVRLFAHLARWVVRHPWYPIIFWVALLLVSIPFLPLLGSVTTNSSETVPASAPSAQASAELARLFPNETGGSSSILLLYGPNLTDANAQRVVMNVTAALERDRSLQDISSIATVYTRYASYLAGQARLSDGVIRQGLTESPPVTTSINQSAALLWGPPSAFFSTWTTLLPSYPHPWQANYPAFREVNSSLANATLSAVLEAFYGGFNGTADCANASNTLLCADGVARTYEAPLIPSLFAPAARAVPVTALATLGIENSTAWPSVRAATSLFLGGISGLPGRFIDLVWGTFPTLAPPASLVGGWANATVANSTLATEPLPVPYLLSSPFVNAAGTATIIEVSYSEPDDYKNGSGGQPVYADIPQIDTLVSGVVHASDPTRSISYVQTGPAPLDLLTQESVNSSLALVLPLTVGLLLVIAMVYFRSPVTPLVTFAGLGIALVLGLGGTVLIGTLVGHVDTSSLSLEEVFVLGVGTDYSVFLVARYKEELVHGRSRDEAIIVSVSWAGQSVATSGATAIIATLALTFSGVALLSQWGSVLSLSILITILVSLTMVPAFLKLLGPRIFWPTAGERFRRHAEGISERVRAERTYFYRAGRVTQRRPAVVLGALLLVSVPLVAVALTVPLSYDFYQQLPSGHPATDGLSELGRQFGPGFATPSYALATFRSPLLVQNTTNASEFVDLAGLTTLAVQTNGIASVRSPVGPSGASLSVWLNLSVLPPATRTNLVQVLSGFVGADGRTVLLDLIPASTGLSFSAVQALQSVESSFGTYRASHSDVVAVAYGGGAPVINDLAQETATATVYLIVAVTIGLVVVLLVALRSWIIALMAIATIGLSISWAWALTYLFFEQLLGFPLFFYVRTLLIILVLGLGIDYNIFLLTRVREERLRGRSSGEAAVEAVARTGGIITAAAVILACAFASLTVGSFVLIRAIGFSVAIAVILDAMVVRTYLVPAALQLLGDRVWSLLGRRRRPVAAPARDGSLEAKPDVRDSPSAGPEPTG